MVRLSGGEGEASGDLAGLQYDPHVAGAAPTLQPTLPYSAPKKSQTRSGARGLTPLAPLPSSPDAGLDLALRRERSAGYDPDTMQPCCPLLLARPVPAR